MARPKSYVRSEALERACHAFWRHGYGALGVRGIEEITGLNQFAIRTEFGGKQGLYLEALRYYKDQAETYALAPIGESGVNGIVLFFQNLTNSASLTSSKWGCLIVNTGVENATIANLEIAAAVGDYWQSLGRHFAAALKRSIENGELIPDLDVAEACATLVSAVMGIHTVNRICGSPTAGEPMVQMVLEWIEYRRL